MSVDPFACPDCGSRFARGAACCPACGLPLTGPLAAELWRTVQDIDRLQAARRALLRRLREAPPASGGLAERPPAASRRRREARPLTVQNLLLGLGVLLLTVAALVFVAVAWGRLGVGGRVALLLAVTAGTVAAVPVAQRRGLSSTAEALAALSVGLALLDAWGMRAAGVLAAQRPAAALYWAGASAAIAALAGLGARRVREVRAWRWACAGLGQLPGLLVAEWLSATGRPLVAALVLGAQALAGTGLARRLTDLTALLGPAAALAWSLGTSLAAGEALAPGTSLAGIVTLLALAAVAAALAALLGSARPSRHLAVAAAAIAAGLAAYAPAFVTLRPEALPLAVTGIALLGVLAAAAVPRAFRAGAVAVAAAAVLGALAAVASGIAEALAGPFTWVAAPWTASAAGSARALVAVEGPWSGNGSEPLVALAAGIVLGTGLALLDRAAAVPAVAAVAGVAVALTAPLAADAPYALALAVEAGLVAVLVAVRRRGAFLLAAAAAVHAVAWSLAAQAATVVVLPVAAALAVVVAVLDSTLRPVAAGCAAVLAASEVYAVARAAGTPADRAGFLLALAAVVVVTIGTAVRRHAPDGPALELAGAAAYAVALVAVIPDPGWTSYTCALGGLAALAVALRPQRRRAALLGAALLTLAGWARLALEGVEAPEAYLAPVGALALALGELRRRREPGPSSWRAHAPGLTLLLLPSLVVLLAGDPGLARPLLLGAVALAVLLVGARARLQAPLAYGAVALGLDALLQVAPAVAALPRWLTLGAAGVLLVGLGATYERRLADLRQWRDGFARLG